MLRWLVSLVSLLLLGGCAAAIVGGAAAGASAAHDRRTFGSVIDDNAIELTAYDSINKDKELALDNNVSVVAHNGVLLIIGQARTAELRARTETKVQGIAGVKRIVNEIEVREPTGLGVRSHDKWITVRVKAALLDIVDLPDFDASRVNVTTENRAVYLMGLVKQDESQRVIEIARSVPGVERVVNVFEYID